jgi:hypothetical protein
VIVPSIYILVARFTERFFGIPEEDDQGPEGGELPPGATPVPVIEPIN